MDPHHDTQESSLSDVAIATLSNSNSSSSSSDCLNKGSSPDKQILPNASPHRNTDQNIDRRSEEGFSCKKYVTKRLPILKWLPTYKKTDIVPDAIAGVTVGLTAIPQSMAYANIAGLTPEFGLYSCFISGFVYVFLGSCRQTTIGPTALMELLVYETCGQDFASCVILSGFYVGVIQLAMGILQIGAVVSLISDPVTIGFVGGASLTIASSQFKGFLGISGPRGKGFLGTCKAVIQNIRTAQLGDSLLGVTCVCLLLILKNLKDYVKPSTASRSGRVVSKLLWLCSIGRNAIVVICASILAASLASPPFALTGSVKSGFPPVHPPQFELPKFHSNNPTDDNSTSNNDNAFSGMSDLSGNGTSSNGTLSFWETLGELRTGPLTIAVISILQNVGVAKAFGSGQSIDASQEMIALGVSHICASFFSALPVAGSFSRSAVNEASGVRSSISGVFTGLLVIFALSFLTPWFAFLPKSALCSVVLCAVLPMIEYETIVPMWKVSKLDVLSCAITFLMALFFGMEYGIIVGVGASLAIYLIRPVRPRVEWSIEDGTRRTNDNNVIITEEKRGKGSGSSGSTGNVIGTEIPSLPLPLRL